RLQGDWSSDVCSSDLFTFEVTPSKFIENHKEPKTCVYLPLEHQASDLVWLQDRIQEAIEKYDVRAVFIDHLHYVIDMKSKQTMRSEERRVGKSVEVVW